jgi:hypothetical protein
MGMDGDTVELFLNNPSFSPAASTVLVTALESMKEVENLDLFVLVALQAAEPNMARVFTQITVMTAAYHNKIAPLKTVSPMARLTHGVRKDGAAVIVLPADHMIWNERVVETLTASSGELKESHTELWVKGSLSKQAAENFQQMSWKVHTNINSKLFPEQN